MVFKVVITAPAEQDIDEATQYIADDSQSADSKWNAELWTVIFSLKEMPSRFSVIPEAEELGFPYRSISHYAHRMIFRIDETSETVFIIRVFHGARRSLTQEEV